MTKEDLINIAKKAQKNAFAPVTNYGVGAAVLAKSGTVYIGTNVEEYSIIGLSNCAERVAIQNAIAHGEREFEAIAIVGGDLKNKELDNTVVPCGVCLQYILDICKDIDIIAYMNNKLVQGKVTEFLNSPFELKLQRSNSGVSN